MAGVIDGGTLRIYVGTDGLGYATSCSLDLSVETRETIHKDAAGGNWADAEPGTISATLSFEGFFSEDTTINSNARESVSDLFGYVNSGTLISWRFTTDVSTEAVWSGSGYITALNFSGNVDENATYSGTISVTGAVTEGDVA